MKIPVYQQIKDIIREEIAQGKYKPGDLLPSANQLAEMFSTSRNTAVKAINDLAMEGAIRCIQGKGSLVNDLRRKMPGKHSGNGRKSLVPDIGILVMDFNDPNSPYFSRLIGGISEKAKSVPCNLKTFCISNYSINDFVRREYFDGLIVAAKLPQSSVFVLKQNAIPFVLAGNDLYGEELLCVTGDSYDSAYTALEYLHSLGHEKIAVFAGPTNARSTPLAYLAYRHAMNHFRLEIDEGLFRACDYGETAGYNAFLSLIRTGRIPTAVFAQEDNIAVGVIKAAAENSLKVPDDLSVIGCGDRFPVSNVKIPLTTFEDRLGDIGALCLEMIVKKLRNEEISESKVCLKSKLIIRNSCAIKKLRN
ncbi:MAG: GntR family transcriptional regulator [Victivallaceae bacterium]|nr:GntR family transcriptional regulator [Victivallaceae bacterium]